MNRVKPHLAAAFLALLATFAGQAAEGPPPVYSETPATGYQDCVTHSCKVVPEKKQIKKTVYEVKEEPYCIKRLPPLLSLFHHHGCECAECAECRCPRYRKVLVKKEVVCKEICTSKCVVEEHVERVPCPVCK